jgi:hypothetical protein
MRDWDAHKLLSERLGRAQCQWILSSYDKPEVRDLFAHQFITPVQASSGMNTDKNGSTRVLNKEILITNFAPPSGLTDTQGKGNQQPLNLGV